MWTTKNHRGRNSFRRGSRMPVIRYPKGISGKQTARIIPESKWENKILYLADSNARDLVSPCVVRPSENLKYNFCPISIPGGKFTHGDMELQNSSTKLNNVTAVVIALGTNDVLGFQEWEVDEYPEYVVRTIVSRAQKIIRTAKSVYPEAKMYYDGLRLWLCQLEEWLAEAGKADMVERAQEIPVVCPLSNVNEEVRSRDTQKAPPITLPGGTYASVVTKRSGLGARANVGSARKM